MRYILRFWVDVIFWEVVPIQPITDRFSKRKQTGLPVDPVFATHHSLG